MPPKITNVISTEQKVENTKRQHLNPNAALIKLYDAKISHIRKKVFEDLQNIDKNQESLANLFKLQKLIAPGETHKKFEDLSVEEKKIVENLNDKGIEVITKKSDGEEIIENTKLDHLIKKVRFYIQHTQNIIQEKFSEQKNLLQLGKTSIDLTPNTRIVANLAK